MIFAKSIHQYQRVKITKIHQEILAKDINCLLVTGCFLIWSEGSSDGTDLRRVSNVPSAFPVFSKNLFSLNPVKKYAKTNMHLKSSVFYAKSFTCNFL